MMVTLASIIRVTQMNSLTKTAAAMALVLGGAQVNTALAIDTDPLDYVPAPAGTNLAVLYLYGLASDKQYYKSEKVGNSDLRANSGLLRAARFFAVAGFRLNANVMIPYHDLTLDDHRRSIGASGLGDPLLAGALWLVNRPQSRTYFAIGNYLQFPLGNYDKNRGLNPGQNRYSYTIQPALSLGLGKRATLDLVTDAQFFSANRDIAGGGQLERAPLFSVQVHLTQPVTQKFSVSIGGYHYFGGETTIRGGNQHDSARNTTGIVTLSYWALKNANVQFQYRRDTQIQNGAAMDGYQLRLLYLF